MVWIKDRGGRYRWVNRAFLINYSLDDRGDRTDPDSREVLGKTDYDLSPAFLADQFRLDDEYVLAGNRIVNRIELVGQPDGLAVWSVTNKIPLVDDGGSVIGTAGTTRRLATSGQAIAPGSEFGPVLDYMRDHYHAPITNRQLARLVHMSVRAFERKFHGNFHLTPQKYLRKLQMRMASRAWSIPARRWRTSRPAAASPIRATSRENFAVISAAPPENIANITPGRETMPLLFQILPLASKNRPARLRYSPPVRWAERVSPEDDRGLRPGGSVPCPHGSIAG